MMEMHEIVRKPLVLTEKGEHLKEAQNKVLFEVSSKANKTQIKQAVEKLFNVKVIDVNTLNVRGKTSRMGRRVGKRSNWKKAIITLNQGDKIEFFEGV